jgi:hypothetical protein
MFKRKSPSRQRQRAGSDRNSHGPAPLHISPNFRLRARSPARVSSLTIGGRSFMRSITALLAALVAGVLLGCSVPMRITVVNRSGTDLSVEFEDGKKKTIPAGQSAELRYTYFFMNASIAHAGVKKKFGWKLPPRELVDSRHYPGRLSVCLEPDGKIYAADATAGDGGQTPVQPQPDGFPLASIP